MSTENEKDSGYHKTRRAGANTKTRTPSTESLLCAQWNMEDFVNYKLMEHERTIIGDIY